MYNEPWSDINDYPVAHCEALVAELNKELPANHMLFGLASKVIAKREDRDDILVSNEQGYFVVHLTWSGKTEQGSFPTFEKFDTLEKLKTKLASDSEFY